jgi:hypothetical protein
MILYNVTVSIDPEIAEEWLTWMREVHIPDVMATGCFIESRISRVHGEEEGGMTYAITYLSPSQALLDEYQSNHAAALQREHSLKYDGRFAAFRTMLSVIEEFRSHVS